MLPASKNDALLALLRGTTAAARVIECNLMSVDTLLDDLLMEEYEAMHRILLSLGVVNADELLAVLVKELRPLPDEVTEKHAASYLAAFEYESGHSKLEANTRADQLVMALARLIRASRIHKAMADGCWMLTGLRVNTMVGMQVLVRASEG